MSDIRSARILSLFFVAVVAAAAGSCHARSNEFFQNVFLCDPNDGDDKCGTTADGRPMTCFAAEALGGQSFCTERCADDAMAPDAGTVCTSSHARLHTCRPSGNPAGDGPANCPDSLACYRTDALADEGVCLPIALCASDDDCPDHARNKCMGTLVPQRYTQLAGVSTDHYQCVQDMCSKSQSFCKPSESCLAVLTPFDPTIPDICVPNCDGAGNCPPNFYCANKFSPIAPKICIPDILGYQCQDRLDCMFGDCVVSGAGFNVCAEPCETHQDCVRYGEAHTSFVCLPDAAGGPTKHCIGVSSFGGAACNPLSTTNTCPDGQQCFMYNPYHQVQFGECRNPCGADGSCPTLAGLGQVCLGDIGGCYPGRFGFPCASSDQCVADFQCEPVMVPADAGKPAAGATHVCTVPCVTDVDCDADPWTDGAGYCQEGFCLLGHGVGDPCARDKQCRTRNCLPQGTCGEGAPPPP